MTVWRQELPNSYARYTAGVLDRNIYRNLNGDWVACRQDGKHVVVRWRWLAKIAADWWL